MPGESDGGVAVLVTNSGAVVHCKGYGTLEDYAKWERALRPQDVTFWGLAALDPSHTHPEDSGSSPLPCLNGLGGDNVRGRVQNAVT